MANPSYLSGNELGKRIWARRFLDNLEEHGPGCGLSPEVIVSCQADLRYYIWLLEEWYPAMQEFFKTATAYKSNMGKKTSSVDLTRPTPPVFTDIPATRPPDLLSRVIAVVNQIRNAPGYNHEIVGKALGIVPVAATDSGHLAPTFRIIIRRGVDRIVVELIFCKYGHVAVYIECRINGGAWEFLAIDDAKPHVDERPLRTANVPEIREYRMRFFDQGVPNGEWSAIQSISVTA